jgi:hypothetical protein
MKSFTMKALAVAVLGLAGTSLASAATCPSDPAQSGGGAWSSKSVGGGGALTISSPGLHSTSCALNVNVGSAPLANVRAFVSDTSPVNEQRYRARFYFDISALTGLTLANDQTEIFDAFSDTAPGTFNTDEIQVFLIGGASKQLRFFVADAGQASGFKTINSGALPTSASGHYYFEFDLTKGAGSSSVVSCAGGAAGCFRYWIAAEGGTAPADANPTGTYSASNAGWSGVTQANLGLFGTSAKFRTDNSSKPFQVDEFDSRRQTFIGF